MKRERGRARGSTGAHSTLGAHVTDLRLRNTSVVATRNATLVSRSRDRLAPLSPRPRAAVPVRWRPGGRGQRHGTPRLSPREPALAFIVKNTRTSERDRPSHMHSSTRASDPEHTPPFKRRRVRWPHTQRVAHNTRRGCVGSIDRAPPQRPSARAPFPAARSTRRARSNPRCVTSHALSLAPRPFGHSPSVGTLDVRIAHIAHAPSSSHLCPLLRPASPCLRACHDRVCGAPTIDADRSPFVPLCLALARGQAPHASTGASPEHRPHRCSQ